MPRECHGNATPGFRRNGKPGQQTDEIFTACSRREIEASSVRLVPTRPLSLPPEGPLGAHSGCSPRQNTQRRTTGRGSKEGPCSPRAALSVRPSGSA
ncbi:unnamed protein product [Lota lota]